MKRAQDETGLAKIFSVNITTDDHYEMLARADFILKTFAPDDDKVAFLVDGFVGGPGVITTARRQYPNQYLHCHRAGHGMITSPSAKRGYTSFVLAKISRACRELPASTSAPWATERWKAKTLTGTSPT